MKKLLTRDEFREGVFARDKHKCVICGEPAVDAHHILERRLFTAPEEFGGYFLDNGASLCTKHHIQAEETTLSCEQIRAAAGIETIVIPEHLYGDQNYDKWGNIIMPNGLRLKGDLFYDESVQKILKQGGVVDEFSKYVKAPRTYHLTWSELGKDDRKHKGGELEGEYVIGSLKLDGENTTMYNDFIHPRSLDGTGHAEDRSWVKGLWGNIGWMLDDNMRVCGENLYAKHTIHYQDLKSYFYVFGIWQDNICLSWKETKEYAGILGLETVPVFYEGIFDPKAIQNLFDREYRSKHEGYVLRVADAFTYGEFRKSVGKFVTPEFKKKMNQESHGRHWRRGPITPNQLIS
jgi:hypothetical protein